MRTVAARFERGDESGHAAARDRRREPQSSASTRRMSATIRGPDIVLVQVWVAWNLRGHGSDLTDFARRRKRGESCEA
jgi:hypothetical protein